MKDESHSRQTKRLFDLLLTIPGIIILSPLLALIAVLVRVKLGKPVLFCQKRPGLHEKPFTIYKFRTMTDERDNNGNLLPDSKRLTRFGQFLRSTSIDELPELWNVIKGDMSLVGPRPLLMEYLPMYNRFQNQRHKMPPGITGWAQVMGRNKLSWEDKFAMDVWYVNNNTLLLDIKIVLMTILSVLKREGINQAGHSTAEKFGKYRLNIHKTEKGEKS